MLSTFKSILKHFHIASLIIVIACITWWLGMEMLEIFAYRTVAIVHFTDQNWISKPVYCIRCVMFFKVSFTSWNAKIALLRATIFVTYYLKLFRMGDNRHNGILMSLLFLVADTIKDCAMGTVYPLEDKISLYLRMAYSV